MATKISSANITSAFKIHVKINQLKEHLFYSKALANPLAALHIPLGQMLLLYAKNLLFIYLFI